MGNSPRVAGQLEYNCTAIRKTCQKPCRSPRKSLMATTTDKEGQNSGCSGELGWEAPLGPKEAQCDCNFHLIGLSSLYSSRWPNTHHQQEQRLSCSLCRSSRGPKAHPQQEPQSEATNKILLPSRNISIYGTCKAAKVTQQKRTQPRTKEFVLGAQVRQHTAFVP